MERNFQKERRYESRYGAKTKDGLKSVQEITIAKIVVQNLAEFCIGKQKEFREKNRSLEFLKLKQRETWKTPESYDVT